MSVIDSSVYVSATLATDSNHLAAYRWLRNAHGASDRLVAPWILASEVGSAILRATGDVPLALQVVHTMINSGIIELVPVGPSLAQEAATIAVRQRIRGCDAIYVALAASTGDTLVTFDKQQATRAAAVVAVHQPT